MGLEELIRVKGDPDSLAPLEGIGGGDISTTGGTDGTDGTDGTGTGTGGAISDAMWAAQSLYIEGETAYLTQLNNEWKDVKDKVDGGIITKALEKIWDALGELAEVAAFSAIVALLAKVGLVLTGGWAVAVGVIVSLAIQAGADWIKGAFVAFLGQSNALFEAMIAENTAMLQAENSISNYELRNAVRAVHLQTISMLLEELDRFRKTAEKISGKDMNLEGIETQLKSISDGMGQGFNSAKLEQILQTGLTRPKTDGAGGVVTDELGYIVYEGILDPRLEDLAYNGDSFRVGDVEISTRGRWVKH